MDLCPKNKTVEVGYVKRCILRYVPTEGVLFSDSSSRSEILRQRNFNVDEILRPLLGPQNDEVGRASDAVLTLTLSVSKGKGKE